MDPNVIRMYQRNDVEWSLTHTDTGTELCRTEWPAPMTEVQLVHSHQQIQRCIQRSISDAAKPQALPHPKITRLCMIWSNSRTWTDDSTIYKQRTTTAQALALAATQETENTLLWRHHRVADALARVPWKRIHTIPGSTCRQRMLFYLLKSNRVNSWNILTGKSGSPHQQCADKTIFDGIHTYWECPAAKRIWEFIFRR